MKIADRPGAAFRRFAVSNLCAQAAEQIGLATAPIIAVYLFQATARETAMLQMVQSAPFLLMAIPAGMLADRTSPRAMLIGAELIRSASVSIILLLLFSDTLTLSYLAALGFLGAAGTVGYNVTAPGTTPMLVDRADLPVANSRLELARSVAFTAGPGIAGLFYHATGGAASYAIALVLSSTAAGMAATLPLQRRPAAQRRHVLHELSEGCRFTFLNPHLRPVLMTAVVFNVSWFILQASFVPFAAQRLNMNAADVGAAMAIYGVGMVCGALITPRLARALPFGMLITVGPIGGLLGAVLMASAIWLPVIALAWAGFFFFGAGPVVWAATTATLRQAVTPASLMGRVSVVVTTCTFGARPIGGFAAAVIAAAYGPSACILAAAAGFFVQAAIILYSDIRRLTAIPAPGTA